MLGVNGLVTVGMIIVLVVWLTGSVYLMALLINFMIETLSG